MIYGLFKDIEKNEEIEDEQVLLALLGDVIKIIVVTTIGFYVLSILIFLVLFGRCNVLIDILFSTLSLLFYLATYLNIFNIYALCRIDDISWGTKGKDADIDAT